MKEILFSFADWWGFEPAPAVCDLGNRKGQGSTGEPRGYSRWPRSDHVWGHYSSTDNKLLTSYLSFPHPTHMVSVWYIHLEMNPIIATFLAVWCTPHLVCTFSPNPSLHCTVILHTHICMYPARKISTIRGEKVKWCICHFLKTELVFTHQVFLKCMLFNAFFHWTLQTMRTENHEFTRFEDGRYR